MTKTNSTTETKIASAELIAQAIAGGKALIEQGKPKIDAAMHIYLALLGHDQEEVVTAFIAGASLTPKGAVTYWYNCRRKHSRLNASAPE